MYFTICYIVAYRTADLEEKKRKKIRIVLFSIFFVIYSVCFFIASNSRIELYDDFLYQFSGPTINIISAICYGIFIVFIFVLFIKNKELSKNQLLPLLYAVIVVVCVFGTQIFGYDFNYLTYLLTFLLAAIFFTTENQDFKLLGELEESKKIADNENVAQSKFLEKISHEVRSPLNNILGLSDILLTEPEFNFENIKADALNIQKSSAYLLNLTNHIADISQIESGKEKVEEAEYALADIIDSIYDNVNKKLLKDDVSFSINVDENLPKSYYGDAEKIKKIILNVLFNAFNYSSNGNSYDFVELYNYGDNDINLEGLSLSDNPDNLNKYIFPDATIKSHDYLVIYLTGGEEIENNLYASFKLSDNDSKLLLSSNGKIIDEIDVVKLKDNMSYGRYDDKWYYFYIPTPNMENNTKREEAIRQDGSS